VELPFPFTVIDVLVVMLLAVGAFVGWMQGFVRYLLASFAVLVAFIGGAQLKSSTTEQLAFWTAFTPRIRETLVFLVFFLLFVAALWLLVRTLGPSLRLPVNRVVDGVGGAVMGAVFAALCVVFVQLVLATHYERPRDPDFAATFQRGGEAAALLGTHTALSDSGLVTLLRRSLVPTVGLLVRPLVPDDTRAVL